MPPVELRHPMLRAQHRCSRCNNVKEVGLVLCWPCFRMWKQAPMELERLLDANEEILQNRGLLDALIGRAMKTINPKKEHKHVTGDEGEVA